MELRGIEDPEVVWLRSQIMIARGKLFGIEEG